MVYIIKKLFYIRRSLNPHAIQKFQIPDCTEIPAILWTAAFHYGSLANFAKYFFNPKSMQVLSIIAKTYEVYKSIVDINHNLPRRYRFGLGISTENGVLELLEYLIMAKHAPKTTKSAYLIKANAALEILRIKLRLFLDLKLVNETKIFQMQSELKEIGRMLGGWMKQAQS